MHDDGVAHAISRSSFGPLPRFGLVSSVHDDGAADALAADPMTNAVASGRHATRERFRP
jgi:hypothetical protein